MGQLVRGRVIAALSQPIFGLKLLKRYNLGILKENSSGFATAVFSLHPALRIPDIKRSITSRQFY